MHVGRYTIALLAGWSEAGRREPVGALRWHHHPFLTATVALLVVWPLVLSAPTRSAAHSATPGLPTLRLSYYAYGPPATWLLDPALAGCTNIVCPPDAVQVLALVQANLVKVLPNGKPVPDLATWKVGKNGRVYTFTIRTNARFANGHPVTAQDAAFSLRRSFAPSVGGSTAWVYLLGLIQGAAAYSQGTSTSLPGVQVLGLDPAR